MRYAIAVTALLSCFGTISPAYAQLRLLDVMNWKFHGPVSSIEEHEYTYDYDTKALATEPEHTRIYQFDDQSVLQSIEATDPYGKTRYTLAYDDAGRLESLNRFRVANSGKELEDEHACQRDAAGEISGLTISQISGIVSLTLKRRVENVAADGHRQIKTFEPEEDGGRPQRLFFVAPDRLMAIYTYDGYSEPERVTKMELFHKNGLLGETRSLNDADNPKKVTSREKHEYEFDPQGNWTSRTTHSSISDRINRRVTRKVTYREP